MAATLHWRLGLICLVACSAGCFYVPLPRTPVDSRSPDPPDLIGEPGSDKPIQPNLATRQQVVRLIGEPDRQSADGKVLGYSRQYKGGAWVAPLCFYGWRQRVDVAYRLEFDAQDILIRQRSVDATARDSFLGPGYGPADEVEDLLDQIGPAASANVPPVYTAPSPAMPTPSPYRNTMPDGRWYETR